MTETDEHREGRDAEIWIVDAIHQGVALLVLNATAGEPVVSEVDADLLGEHAVEGTVLSVPVGRVGEPIWEEALSVGDPAEE